MDFISDKNVEKLVKQGLTPSEAYDFLYLLSLKSDTKLSSVEEARLDELSKKKRL